MKLAAAASQLTQIALQHRMGVEADRIVVDQTMDRVFPQQRTQGVDTRRLEPAYLRELPDFDLESVERLTLIFARVNENRHGVTERSVREAIRRIFDEAAAGKRQRANETIAEEIMEHRRASPRRVKADLLLGLEHRHSGLAREDGCRGEARDPAADHQYVGTAHRIRRR